MVSYVSHNIDKLMEKQDALNPIDKLACFCDKGRLAWNFLLIFLLESILSVT